MLTHETLDRLRHHFRQELGTSPLNPEQARIVELMFERTLTATALEERPPMVTYGKRASA